MQKTASADEIEARAAAAGLTVRDLCREVGIAESTFWRWKSDRHSVKVSIYDRMVDVIEEAK